MAKAKIISYFDKVNHKGYISYSARQLSLAIGLSRTTLFAKLYESGYYEDDKIMVFCIDRQQLIKGLGKNKGHFKDNKQRILTPVTVPLIPQMVQKSIPSPITKNNVTNAWKEAREELDKEKKK